MDAAHPMTAVDFSIRRFKALKRSGNAGPTTAAPKRPEAGASPRRILRQNRNLMIWKKSALPASEKAFAKSVQSRLHQPAVLLPEQVARTVLLGQQIGESGFPQGFPETVARLLPDPVNRAGRCLAAGIRVQQAVV